MTSVAVIQPAAPWRAPDAARESSARLSRRAVTAGARSAILRELCTISYDFQSRDQIEPTAEPPTH
jgi:predicted amidohydrolase